MKQLIDSQEENNKLAEQQTTLAESEKPRSPPQESKNSFLRHTRNKPSFCIPRYVLV